MIDHELIKRALAEDLQGGEDITSVATVSGTEKVVADFVSRRAGVIAGIDMARAVLVEVGLKDIAGPHELDPRPHHLAIALRGMAHADERMAGQQVRQRIWGRISPVLPLPLGEAGRRPGEGAWAGAPIFCTLTPTLSQMERGHAASRIGSGRLARGEDGGQAAGGAVAACAGARRRHTLRDEPAAGQVVVVGEDDVERVQRQEGHAGRPGRGGRDAERRQAALIRQESRDAPLERRQAGDRGAGEVGEHAAHGRDRRREPPSLGGRILGARGLDDGVDRIGRDERVATEPRAVDRGGRVGERAIEPERVGQAGEPGEDRRGIDARGRLGHERAGGRVPMAGDPGMRGGRAGRDGRRHQASSVVASPPVSGPAATASPGGSARRAASAAARDGP